MFNHAQLDPLLVKPENNGLKYHNDYASVMQFISKNTVIPDYLASFADSVQDQANISTLLRAIESANFKDEIYSHPHCELYALYLFKENKISMQTFVTLHVYLTVLMQFTNMQNLREEDNDLKRLTNVSTVPYDSEWIKRHFFGKIKLFLSKKYGTKTLDQARLSEALKDLNDFDKTFILILIPTETKDHQVVKPYLMTDEIKRILNVYGVDTELVLFNLHGYLYIPSAALFDKVLYAVNPDHPVKMAPIFGNISVATLHKFHQIGLRPVNLYSKHVKSNPAMVHNQRLGPFYVLSHDLYFHLALVNTLSKNHFDFVQQYLIPTVAKSANLTLQKAIANDRSYSLPLLIDIEIRVRRMDVNDPDVYLYQCLKHALVNDKTQIQTIFNAIYADKEHLKNIYNIDLDKMFELPVMNDKYALFRGVDLLANARGGRPQLSK